MLAIPNHSQSISMAEIVSKEVTKKIKGWICYQGDAYREVPVNETFHEQTDNELSEKELKHVKVDDQAIQTILLGLPEDIYVVVDSCETARKSGYERFTSTDGESIESNYYRFSKLMNDFKINKHFPEKIASNLKFLNNLQPEWSRHVTIVHQTKDLHAADYTQLYDLEAERLNVRNPNELIVVSGVADQNPNGNGNVIATRAEGNINGNNADLDEIKEVNANCILMANLQQASTSEEQLLSSCAIPETIPSKQNVVFVYSISTVASPSRYGARVESSMALLILLKDLKTAYQAQQKQQSLYNGNVLLDKHDPLAVHDSEETLELTQEKAAKFVRDIKSLAKEADESLAKDKALELEIERLLRAVVSQDIMSIVWICQISQEISQKRTRERMSDQEAKDLKAEAREIMPQPSSVNCS
ncbi:hypothetical protein Tco_0794497 [Tanacetum coccineum]